MARTRTPSQSFSHFNIFSHFPTPQVSPNGSKGSGKRKQHGEKRELRERKTKGMVLPRKTYGFATQKVWYWRAKGMVWENGAQRHGKQRENGCAPPPRRHTPRPTPARPRGGDPRQRETTHRPPTRPPWPPRTQAQRPAARAHSRPQRADRTARAAG